MLKDRHRGERGVIVANGPSLNRMDLAFLRRETVVGMNKIHLGFDRFGFYPRYYVAVNRHVIEQSQRHIRALNCVKFIGDRGSEGRIQEDALTYLLNTREPPARFCHDIAQGLHEGWTVTYAALQVARYLGFQEVVLIGLDHRYRYEGSPNELLKFEGPDHNHFSEAYFGHGQAWNNPDLERSEESYRIARTEYEKEGRRILDATVDGACTLFEKVDHRDIFQS
ncbi:6-hydroxymethylpterin diphosphokinase MptE-like protein [Marilutibacter aestuarii]|nr:6-hydroxymethylpterin diphosphokinase MptE-like protein [Lysobacter aestuarii]